jgi:hypothetical protein
MPPNPRTPRKSRPTQRRAKLRRTLLQGDWYVGDGFDADQWDPAAKPRRRKRIPKGWTKVRVEKPKKRRKRRG